MTVFIKNYAVATAANAVATIGGGSSSTEQVELSQIVWSYSGTLTVLGTINVWDGPVGSGTLALSVDITTDGPGFLPLNDFVSSPGNQINVVLTSGGAGIVGKIAIVGVQL